MSRVVPDFGQEFGIIPQESLQLQYITLSGVQRSGLYFLVTWFSAHGYILTQVFGNSHFSFSNATSRRVRTAPTF